MIESIKINWKNCFGIKQLEHEFKFASGKPIHLLYAPNGTMKTSFAKTMKFLSGQSKEKPCDKLHQDEESKYDVLVDNNTISKDFVFVVNGDENIDCASSFVNFLASSELKSKYDNIYNKLNKEKDALMTKLKNVSNSTDCEKEIIEAFSSNNNVTIFNILNIMLYSTQKEQLKVFLRQTKAV